MIHFDKCICEHGIYVEHSTDKGTLLVCLYVDDILVTGNIEDIIAISCHLCLKNLI